jgi:hypothetical protein
MKSIYLSILMAFAFLFATDSWAHRASHFRGVYELVSQVRSADEDPAPAKYMLIDVDTMGGIWEKYGDGDLPADLEKYRNESTILVGFTFRNTLFLTLEAGAQITGKFLGISGSENSRFELAQRADGQYDMAIRENNVVNVYVMGAPQPLELGNKRFQLRLNPSID